jgi:hypothetical protein
MEDIAARVERLTRELGRLGMHLTAWQRRVLTAAALANREAGALAQDGQHL